MKNPTHLIPIRRARIVHQAIHTPKRTLRCLHQLHPVSSARDVRLMKAHVFRGRGDGGATAFLVDVSDDDAGALRGKALGDAGAEARSAAFCDQC